MKEFPNIETTKDYMEILNDKSINAVVVATPVNTHREIAEKAMTYGKHVFIEKPLASNSSDAEILLNFSQKMNKVLAVGHVFQFAPAVRKIKDLLKEKIIGDIVHITSTRINLGPPDTEVDVIWDLGPHDISIILYLLNEIPSQIISKTNKYPFGAFNTASSKNKIKIINNAHIDLLFNSNISAHVHLSWLSSNKVRLMQIFGTKGTLVYDEMLALDGKLKLYGIGIDNRIKSKDFDSGALKYQTGKIVVIPLEQHEPLRLECQEFINAILYNKKLVNDAKIGYDVVKILEIASNQ